MTSRDFCFWLQGYFEIEGATLGSGGLLKTDEAITGRQVKTIKAHLALVFKHEIDPSMGDQKHQDVLNKIYHKVSPVPSVDTPPWKKQTVEDNPQHIMRC